MWHEIKTLWRDGLEEYMTDLWNYTDFVSTSLYLSDLSIRLFFTFTEVKVYELCCERAG